MSFNEPPPTDDPDDRVLAAQLTAHPPTPGPALGRRVKRSVEIALSRREMRRLALICLSSGFLAVGIAVFFALNPSL